LFLFFQVLILIPKNQVECAKNIWDLLDGSKFAHIHEQEVTLQDDQYTLRQDRYPLRTAPQFLGPQIEDLFAALTSLSQECNSSKYRDSDTLVLVIHNFVQRPTTLSSMGEVAKSTTAVISKLWL